MAGGGLDYRALNKVITNEGWQISNMKDMLQRIGSLKSRVFGETDITMGSIRCPCIRISGKQ